VSLRFIHFLEIGVIADGLDALLQRDDLTRGRGQSCRFLRRQVVALCCEPSVWPRKAGESDLVGFGLD
jgi:hypothetical protein